MLVPQNIEIELKLNLIFGILQTNQIKLKRLNFLHLQYLLFIIEMVYSIIIQQVQHLKKGGSTNQKFLFE